jgi:hypothetical protein
VLWIDWSVSRKEEYQSSLTYHICESWKGWYVNVENNEIYKPLEYEICKMKTRTNNHKTMCKNLKIENCEHLWCDMICKCCELSLKNGKSCSCHSSNNLLTHVVNLVNIPWTQHIAIEQYLKNQRTIMLPQVKQQADS